MAQADFQFLRNVSGIDPEGGPDGRAAVHSTLGNPLVLEGDFGRRYKWTAGDTSVLGMIGSGVDGGIWKPGGTGFGFDVSLAARVSSDGTTNKAVGVSIKTGRVGFDPAFPNLASGYHFFLGAWNIAGTVYGSPTSLTLLMVPVDGDGTNLRAITVASGLATDQWHRIRMQVTPNLAVEDTLTCYTGVKNAGLAASIIPGAPTGSSGASAVMGAPLDPRTVPPVPPSLFVIPVTGLTGMSLTDIGGYMTLSGAVDPLNNGTFRIYDVISATEAQVLRTVDATGTLITPGNEGGLVWSTQQMRVSGLANITTQSAGHILTLANASFPGNNGEYFIVGGDDTQVDVVNVGAVIPDANNGTITWVEGAAAPAKPLDPIWTQRHTEVIDAADPHYCAWGVAASDRVGFLAHNSSGAGGQVYLDSFTAQREAI